ncbi:hypothetical protein F0562_005236 [Nyssa sinensis]|uniref:Uncharacterized protein n=1 Tax=Nyssa sinensis TaxID=561372 RepID=A0A5J5ALZ7_9ASTE|nr:hypothetical protein F0562_005236 [Nyssa sinensis]
MVCLFGSSRQLSKSPIFGSILSFTAAVPICSTAAAQQISNLWFHSLFHCSCSHLFHCSSSSLSILHHHRSANIRSPFVPPSQQQPNWFRLSHSHSRSPSPSQQQPIFMTAEIAASPVHLNNSILTVFVNSLLQNPVTIQFRHCRCIIIRIAPSIAVNTALIVVIHSSPSSSHTRSDHPLFGSCISTTITQRPSPSRSSIATISASRPTTEALAHCYSVTDRRSHSLTHSLTFSLTHSVPRSLLFSHRQKVSLAHSLIHYCSVTD